MITAKKLFNSSPMVTLRDRLNDGPFFDLQAYDNIKYKYTASPIPYDPPGMPLFCDVFDEAMGQSGNIPFHDLCFELAKKKANETLDEQWVKTAVDKLGNNRSKDNRKNCILPRKIYQNMIINGNMNVLLENTRAGWVWRVIRAYASFVREIETIMALQVLLSNFNASIFSMSRQIDSKAKIDIGVKIGGNTFGIQVRNDSSNSDRFAREKETTRMFSSERKKLGLTSEVITLRTPKDPSGNNHANGTVLTHMENADKLITLAEVLINLSFLGFKKK